jgi:hypothetical protein
MNYDPYPMTASEAKGWEEKMEKKKAKIIAGRKDYQEYNKKAKEK